MAAKASDKKFLLRIDEPLFDFFKQLAKKNKRSSINYEIELALREKKERIEKETPPSP